MPSTLIDLHDRLITDSGKTVYKIPFLIKTIINGDAIEHLTVKQNDEILQYNTKNNKNIQVWEDNEEIEDIELDTYNWNIPEEYKCLNIKELANEALLKSELGKEYKDRLNKEIEIIEKLNMYSYIQCLLFITDVFRKNKIIWGVGRGSSCASLLLYLLGINKIDPVKYDIPLEEFYR